MADLARKLDRSTGFVSTATRLEHALFAAIAITLAWLAVYRTPLDPSIGPRAEQIFTTLSVLLVISAVVLVVIGVLEQTPAPEGGRWKWIGRIRNHPRWVRASVIALGFAYVAGRLALAPAGKADYWAAFGFWIAGIVVLFASFAPAQVTLPTIRSMREQRLRGSAVLEAAVIVALTAAAAALRLSDLSGAPTLVHVDEEAIGLESLNVITGQIPNMFTVGWQTLPSMQFFLFAGGLKVFGTNIVALRTVSALMGAAAIPVTYLLVRAMFGRWQATAAGIFLAGFSLHLHFSRIVMANVADTLLMAGALLFGWRASQARRPFDFAATGAIAGLGIYGYHGARAVAVVVGVWMLYVAIVDWRFFRRNFPLIALMLISFAVVVMPLALRFTAQPTLFSARGDASNIFQSGWWDQQISAGRTPVDILWHQTTDAFGGFVYRPESSPFSLYRTPSPFLVGLAAAAFLAGVGYGLVHLDDRRFVLLFLALILPTILGGALAVGTNNGQRYLGTVPSISAFVGIGLWEFGRVCFRWNRPLQVCAVVAAAVLLALLDAQSYFQAATNDLIYGGLVQKPAVDYISSLPADTRIYWFGLPEMSAGFSPLSLHNRRLIEASDNAAADKVRPVEAPSPSVYLFLPNLYDRMSLVTQRCPGGTVKELDLKGQAILRVYELREPNTCVPPTGPPDAFADALDLSRAPLPVIDYTANQKAQVEPGEPLPCGMAGNTVWYTYTPSKDGTLLVTTDGSTFDTVLAAYTGAELPSLEQVACNDDGADLRSSIEMPVKAGTPYRFQIGTSAKGRALVEPDIVRININERPQ